MKSWIIALLLAVTAFAPASAAAGEKWTGAVDFGFSNASKLGVKGDDWSGGLSALFSYDHFNAQLAGTFDRLEPPAGQENLWASKFSGFWRDRKGTIGASFGYGSVSQGGGTVQVKSYGGFAEWYAAHDFTVRFKGGGFSGGSSVDGYYGSIAAEFYATEHFGVTGNYSYVSTNGFRLHNVGLDAEYLPFQEYPFSIGAGYEHAGYSNVSAYLLRLHYRFGLEGSLVEVDRKGPASWDGLAPF